MTNLAAMIEEAATLCDNFGLTGTAAAFRACTTLGELLGVYQLALVAMGAAQMVSGLVKP